MLVIMMEIEFFDVSMIFIICLGLVMMGGLLLLQRIFVLFFSMSVCIKVSDCSRVWVFLEQVFRMRAFSVMLGSRFGLLLMRFRAKSMVFSRWMFFFFLSFLQVLFFEFRSCIGNRFFNVMFLFMRMEFMWGWFLGFFREEGIQEL